MRLWAALMAKGVRKSSPPLPGCLTVCAEKWLQPPPSPLPRMQTMCCTLESRGGDSQISWLIALIPGLSLVILRQIIQDYDLMGCVKSAGKHKQGWGGVLQENIYRKLQFKVSLCELKQLTGCRFRIRRDCLTPQASDVPHAKSSLSHSTSTVLQLSTSRSSAICVCTFMPFRHSSASQRPASFSSARLRCELSTPLNHSNSQ